MAQTFNAEVRQQKKLLKNIKYESDEYDEEILKNSQTCTGRKSINMERR